MGIASNLQQGRSRSGRGVTVSFTLNHRQLAEIDRLMKQLPNTLRESTFKPAMKEATALIRKAVKAAAPKGTAPIPKEHRGDLKKGVTSKIIDKNRDRISGIIYHKAPAHHAHLVEYGHRMFIHGKDTGKMVPPHPYMRPAFEAHKAAAFVLIINKMRAQINATIKSRAR